VLYTMRKKKIMRLSRSIVIIYIYIMLCVIYIYIYIYTSRVSLCIHAFGMTFIGARETRCGNISRPEADIDLCDLDDLEFCIRWNEFLKSTLFIFKSMLIRNDVRIQFYIY